MAAVWCWNTQESPIVMTVTQTSTATSAAISERLSIPAETQRRSAVRRRAARQMAGRTTISVPAASSTRQRTAPRQSMIWQHGNPALASSQRLATILQCRNTTAPSTGRNALAAMRRAPKRITPAVWRHAKRRRFAQSAVSRTVAMPSTILTPQRGAIRMQTATRICARRWAAPCMTPQSAIPPAARQRRPHPKPARSAAM